MDILYQKQDNTVLFYLLCVYKDNWHTEIYHSVRQTVCNDCINRECSRNSLRFMAPQYSIILSGPPPLNGRSKLQDFCDEITYLLDASSAVYSLRRLERKTFFMLGSGGANTVCGLLLAAALLVQFCDISVMITIIL